MEGSGPEGLAQGVISYAYPLSIHRDHFFVLQGSVRATSSPYEALPIFPWQQGAPLSLC